MIRLNLRQLLDQFRLIERRAKGREPGDDVVSRLRLNELAAAPLRWLAMTAAKLAVVAIIAVLAAALFLGGTAMMRALRGQH